MAKIPLVLLPALLCNAGLFIHQIKALEETADIFVPDLGLDTDVRTTAARILSQAPRQFILGGISMGGYVAFEMLRQAPQRIAGLILMDTNAAADSPAAKQKRLEMIETAETGGIDAVIDAALLNIISPAHRDNDIIRHILVHMARSTGVQKYANEQKVIMSRPDSDGTLKKITCPALVLGGAQDALSPPDAMAKIAAAMPNAVHAVIADSGHLPPLENPSAVTGTFRAFLKQVSLS